MAVFLAQKFYLAQIKYVSILSAFLICGPQFYVYFLMLYGSNTCVQSLLCLVPEPNKVNIGSSTAYFLMGNKGGSMRKSSLATQMSLLCMHSVMMLFEAIRLLGISGNGEKQEGFPKELFFFLIGKLFLLLRM